MYRPYDLLSQLLVVVEDNNNNNNNKNKHKNKSSHNGKASGQLQPAQGGLVRVYTAGNKPSMWLLEQTSSSTSSEGPGNSSGGGGGDGVGSGSDAFAAEEDDLCAALYSTAFALVVTVIINPDPHIHILTHSNTLNTIRHSPSSNISLLPLISPR